MVTPLTPSPKERPQCLLCPVFMSLIYMLLQKSVFPGQSIPRLNDCDLHNIVLESFLWSGTGRLSTPQFGSVSPKVTCVFTGLCTERDVCYGNSDVT